MALRMKDADKCTPREPLPRRGHDDVTQMLLDKELAQHTPAINDDDGDGGITIAKYASDGVPIFTLRSTGEDVPARVDVRFNLTAVHRSPAKLCRFC